MRQLHWTNDQLLGVLDVLLDVPADAQPIVILAADEGPFPPEFDSHDFPWLEAAPEQVERKYGILNAVQLYDFVEVQRTDDGALLMPTPGDGG